MFPKYLLKLIVWIVLFLIIIYVTDILSYTPLKSMYKRYEYDDEQSIESNFEDKSVAENICERINYSEDSEHQATMCGKKVKDVYDEMVEKMSNYSVLKEDSLCLNSDVNKMSEDVHWQYKNESALCGGPIYQYKDNDVNAVNEAGSLSQYV